MQIINKMSASAHFYIIALLASYTSAFIPSLMAPVAAPVAQMIGSKIIEKGIQAGSMPNVLIPAGTTAATLYVNTQLSRLEKNINRELQTQYEIRKEIVAMRELIANIETEHREHMLAVKKQIADTDSSIHKYMSILRGKTGCLEGYKMLIEQAIPSLDEPDQGKNTHVPRVFNETTEENFRSLYTESSSQHLLNTREWFSKSFFTHPDYPDLKYCTKLIDELLE